MSLILKNGKCEFGFLYDGIVQSYPLAQPFIAAMQLEGTRRRCLARYVAMWGWCIGSYWFKKPCDCDPLICKDSAECQAGAPWMDNAVHHDNSWIPQEIMCGLKGTAQKNTDSFHPTYQVDPIHYANIWNTCTSPGDENCVLNTSTVTQNIYAPEDYPGARARQARRGRILRCQRRACVLPRLKSM